MRYPNQIERPPGLLDTSDLPQLTKEQHSKGINLAKKIISELLSKKNLFKGASLETVNPKQLSWLYTNLKPSRIKDIKIQLEFTFKYHDYPTKFVLSHGTIFHESLFKNIYDCNLTDAKLLRFGEIISKDEKHQLLSALIIIYGSLIKHFIHVEIKANLTIREAFEEIEGDISKYSQPLLEIYESFKFALSLYDAHDLFENILVEIQETNSLPSYETLKIFYDPSELDALNTKYTPQFIEQCVERITTESSSYYELSLTKLAEAIDKAIDLGLFDQYKAINRKKYQIPPLCTNHSLLNNKKLLKRLDSKELNKLGNNKKTIIYQRLNTRFRDFFISKPEIAELVREKSVAKTVDILSQKYASDLEKIIEEDKALHKHAITIKSENLTSWIDKLIRENIKSQRDDK